MEAEIEQWEHKTGNAFLISGMKYSNYIHTNWEKYKIQKEKEKAERVCTNVKFYPPNKTCIHYLVK